MICACSGDRTSHVLAVLYHWATSPALSVNLEKSSFSGVMSVEMTAGVTRRWEFPHYIKDQAGASDLPKTTSQFHQLLIERNNVSGKTQHKKKHDLCLDQRNDWPAWIWACSLPQDMDPFNHTGGGIHARVRSKIRLTQRSEDWRKLCLQQILDGSPIWQADPSNLWPRILDNRFSD
jgi:hypothetical protein